MANRPCLRARALSCMALGFLLVGVAAGCKGGGKPAPAPKSDLQDVQATVRRFPLDSETFVLIPDGDPETHYLPDHLPQAFRQDGVRVVFSGRFAPIPANVRLVGTPVELLSLRRLDGRGPS